MQLINTSENFPKNLKLYVFANFYEGKTILNRDSGAKRKNTVHRCYCFPRKIFLVTHQDSGRRCLGFESVSGRLPCIRFRYEGAATLFFFNTVRRQVSRGICMYSPTGFFLSKPTDNIPNQNAVNHMQQHLCCANN